MIFNLEQFKQKPKRALAPEREQELVTKIINMMQKHGYMIDTENNKAINKIAAVMAGFFAATEKYECDLDKGIFIFGDCGTGKSFALKLFSAMFNIEFLEAVELAALYSSRGEEAFWDHVNDFRFKHLIIDDLGAERNTKSFGNGSIIPDFLTHREKYFRNNGVLTFISSNLEKRDDLTALYGTRVKSRILGMCEAIKLTGRDRRITN